MITILESDAVLDAAREMNRRDASLLEAGKELGKIDDDDIIWARTDGVRGLHNSNGEPRTVARSFYSWGPYPRNRRLLADIALAAGWNAEKARILERRCVEKMAKHHAACEKQKGFHFVDVSNSAQPMHKGTPFTFQHISWSFLERYIAIEVKEIDPTKLAAVKAAVLNLWKGNSVTGQKRMPKYEAGIVRISDDLPVSKADLQNAQDEIDSVERRRKAYAMQHYEGRFRPPPSLKKEIRAYIRAKDISEAEFCEAIDVEEEELMSFFVEMKQEKLLGTKVFHNAMDLLHPGKKAAAKAKRKRDAAEGGTNEGAPPTRKAKHTT